MLLESGRVAPCRAVELGCGTGRNAIFLARRGFRVTGVDFSSAAIARAREHAHAARVDVELVVADVTRLDVETDGYDFVLDYGTMEDLVGRAREYYTRSVCALTRPGGLALLVVRAWPEARWTVLVPFAWRPLELRSRFGGAFEIEEVAAEPGSRAYLMRRR